MCGRQPSASAQIIAGIQFFTGERDSDTGFISGGRHSTVWLDLLHAGYGSFVSFKQDGTSSESPLSDDDDLLPRWAGGTSSKCFLSHMADVYHDWLRLVLLLLRYDASLDSCTFTTIRQQKVPGVQRGKKNAITASKVLVMILKLRSINGTLDSSTKDLEKQVDTYLMNSGPITDIS
ncbi:hypothetical protein AB5N19_10551 [Seiridium cardinale]|uniref:Uncharacterized protein n=1 Tax=Seiridium cardinale TaxID=138064 RepID=A0ABR2XGS4_9PEZI